MLPNWISLLRPLASAPQQSAGASWRFDPLSFALGVAVTLLLTVLAYRRRMRLAKRWTALREQADQLRQRLTANMATRYAKNVMASTGTAHLFGALAPVESIHVDTPVQPISAPSPDPGGMLPRPLPLFHIARANKRLVIVGPPGSGRTTQLYALLRRQADPSQKKSADTPIYVYLPLLATDLPGDADQLETDPAQRLVTTALASMSRVVATGVARWLLGQVQTGHALILLDGWDELSPAARPALTAWIQALISAHPDNHIVVTAGERGYAPLVQLGCVPLRPAPWTHRQLTQLADRWAAALGVEPSGETQLPVHPIPPTPLEATIGLVVRLRGQTPGSTPARKPVLSIVEGMAQLIDLLLPAPATDAQGQPAWPVETGHRALGQLALTTLEQGRATLSREEIQFTVNATLPPPRFAPEALQDKSLPKEDQKAAREENDRRVLQVVDCCRALTAAGAPIQTFDNRRYQFAHPLVAAYLAARHLAEAKDGESVLASHAYDPAWRDVLRFYGGLVEAGPVVKHLLGAPDDLFMNRLWTAAAVLAASPANKAAWRAGLIKRLAQLFMTPQAPSLLRDHALTALLRCDEPGIELLFKQLAGHADPFTRAGAILGLGAKGREQELALIEAALRDSHPDVQLAAVNALSLLARRGNEAALELVVAAMIETEGVVQQVAAETLAELEPDGHAILRDAARDNDLVVRRAAVFGLVAVQQPWATTLLQQLQGQDGQWLVRNAAAEALATLDAEKETPPELPLPQAEAEPWLIEWAAARGEGTGVGDAALNTLTRALHDAEPRVRLQAALTLEQLADPRTIDDLRQHLRDPEPLVRDAALAALEQISRQHEIVIGLPGAPKS